SPLSPCGRGDLGERGKLNPVFPPLFIFIFVSALSVIDAPATAAGMRELVKWGEAALLAAITLDLIRRDARRLRWIVWAMLAAGAVHALIGLYEFFGGSGADHLAITLAGRTFYRAFGSFGQPNPFAGFMGVCLVLALGAAWGALTSRARGEGILYLLIALLTGAALLASWSRGAWMGAAAAGVVMALMLPRKLRHGLLLVGALAALFALLWASGKLPGAIVERITDFTDIAAGFGDVRGVDIDHENYAEIERFAHWQAAMSMAEARPWLGVGFGNYPVVYPQHALMNWPDPLGHAHNYYLNTLAETGILGLAAYLFMGAAVVGLTLRVLRRPSTGAWERGVALGLLGVWTYLAIHSLLDKLYVNNVFLHMGVLLGMLAALYADKTRAARQN
ncbi:MAG: O-antigen ligase family protein, partial [Anaerolineae bacterium]|nr:O-antigen ligase family protein [Anaerolineae bacterium]